jgi:SpoVK/Ycf46/Vps4 family AAA+-type ATPase
MGKNRELLDLFRAIGSHDLSRANEVSRKLAMAEGRRGHHRVERDLIGALNGASKATSGSNTMLVHAAWSVESTLMPIKAAKTLDMLELPESLRISLREVIEEWKQRSKLVENNLPRRWRLLFHGPSGCGKTATAAAIAVATGLPGYLVRFDSLIGAYLGQTALRLRELFSYAMHTPCVLLFDEVDALAKRRGSPMDVGELDRIVIAFMQELEHAEGEGFIVATSNLPKALDDALWRRFDLRTPFPRPNSGLLVRFAKKRCREFGFPAPSSLLLQCREASSYAETEQLVIAEARRRVLAK